MITVTKHTITDNDIGKACLIGNTQSGYEKIKKMRDGRDVCIEIKTKINPKYFRLLWGLARCFSKHAHEESYFSNKNEYAIIKSLQLEAGDVIPIMDIKTGEIKMIPDSLSHTNKKINENYEIIENKLFDVVAEVLGVDLQNLRRNYHELL